jgi:hypothetical protein
MERDEIRFDLRNIDEDIDLAECHCFPRVEDFFESVCDRVIMSVELIDMDLRREHDALLSYEGARRLQRKHSDQLHPKEIVLHQMSSQRYFDHDIMFRIAVVFKKELERILGHRISACVTRHC